jgi:hypothetical protein
MQVESVMNDFVRLREECSYHDSGTALEGGYGMAELMADDEDVYQLGGCCQSPAILSVRKFKCNYAWWYIKWATKICGCCLH